MGGLSAASRVGILARLRAGPSTVGELADAVGMAQPAVSHQLRILRDLGLVTSARDRRHVVYELFDPHVALLLDEALRHVEHLRSAGAGPGRDHLPTTATGEPVTDQHTHDRPHEHAHAHQSGIDHAHLHDTHEHAHVDHDHAHAHDGQTHTHPHTHQTGLEDQHVH